MKKIWCLSFLLFATTMSFSATAKADRVQQKVNVTLPGTLRDMPWPDPGCKHPPPCPELPPRF
jgi:hypothetical protein